MTVAIPSGRGRWRLTLHNRQFADVAWGTTMIAELSDARSRQLEQSLNSPAQLTFVLPGNSPAASLIKELSQDVILWRWSESAGRDVAYFRGIVSHSEDELSEQTHTVTFTCHDYLAMMQRRWTTALWNFHQTEQDAIVSSFWQWSTRVSTSNGTSLQPGSYLPFRPWTVNPDGSRRSIPSGQLRDRNYIAAQNIGTLLDDLAHVIGGFDYDIVPGWRFDTAQTWDYLRIFYPSQGIDRTSQFVLEYGGAVSTLTRTIDSSAYANYQWLIGGVPDGSPDGTPPLFGEHWNADANNVTVTPVGLWSNVDNASDVVLQSTLDEQSQGALDISGVLIPQYTAVLRPGFYREGLLNMGDTVPLVVNSGRLHVEDSIRIMGITFDIGDDGQEDVSLTLGRSAFSLIDLLRNQAADVNALARR